MGIVVSDLLNLITCGFIGFTFLIFIYFTILYSYRFCRVRKDLKKIDVMNFDRANAPFKFLLQGYRNLLWKNKTSEYANDVINVDSIGKVSLVSHKK